MIAAIMKMQSPSLLHRNLAVVLGKKVSAGCGVNVSLCRPFCYGSYHTCPFPHPSPLSPCFKLCAQSVIVRFLFCSECQCQSHYFFSDRKMSSGRPHRRLLRFGHSEEHSHYSLTLYLKTKNPNDEHNAVTLSVTSHQPYQLCRVMQSTK